MSERAVQLVPIRKIRVYKNIRVVRNAEDDAGLTQSIREHGVLQPLLLHCLAPDDERVDDVLFGIDDGQRRFECGVAAGLTAFPAIVDPRVLTAAESLQRQLVSNCQRQDLSPMETAAAIERLLSETGCSQAEAGKKLGFSPGKVSRLLTALRGLPEDLREQVISGGGSGLSASAAYQIARAGDPETQQRLAAEVKENRLTRDEVAAKVKGRHKRDGDADAKSTGRVTCQLGGGRSITVSGAGLATLAELIQWLDELLAKARKERKARGDTLDLATFCALLRGDAKASVKTRRGTPVRDEDEDGAAAAVGA